jgi:hypothetical protein
MFGDRTPVSTCEYADAEDGTPNWKRGIRLTDENSNEE